MLKIPALEKLVHEFNRLPGIGPKTAQRLAYHVLRTEGAYAEALAEAVISVKEQVHECTICYNYTDRDLCHFCTDPHRHNDQICVVEEPMDIARIEGSGAFRGRYHVLHGAISPLEGVDPSDLKIPQLSARIEKGLSGEEPKIEELILALDADLEGDTTVLYLTRLLQGKVKLSRIAHGVPIGSDIDYVDDRTMGRALENRVEL